jgi:hypothetical protein
MLRFVNRAGLRHNPFIRIGAGIFVGWLILAIAHLASKALSRWALSGDLIEMHGSWLMPRIAAWTAVCVLAGALLGKIFGRGGLHVALIAVATFFVLLFGTLIYIYRDEWLVLAPNYLVEASVVAVVLPFVAWIVGRRRGA